MLPGTRGGSNWGGGAVDPTTGILFVKSIDSPEIDLLQKVETEKKSVSQSVYLQGRALYKSHCASCHGNDRNGNEPEYPSLVGLQTKMTKENALKKIKQGSGRMPSFSAILSGKEEAILAYLYETSTGSSRNDSFLSEIENNKLSVTGSEKQDEKTDTTPLYLNITAYSHFNDHEGHPAIKPPWEN